MTRYDEKRKADVVAFLSEIVALGKQRGLSLVHEDQGGGFIVEDFDEQAASWLMDAGDQTSDVVPA